MESSIFSNENRCERRCEQIVGSSPALDSVLEQVQRVAPTDSTVLILGETGTGKELIARSIHNSSVRCGRPFIKVNCAAMPFDLLESELFGHEKGAFTGAIAQKPGRFELANTGTLFLDEIGDIPLASQPKLLRVLQEQEFERLGGTRTHRVDIRLIAATHRDLKQMVNRNEFRSDLYYRLSVFPVTLPPLRERRGDILPLVWHFVELLSPRIGKTVQHIPEETLVALLSHDWPGNIRELQNYVERAIILSNDGVFPNLLAQSISGSRLVDAERALILRAVQNADWTIGGACGAAAQLGIKRTTLLAKLKRFGITRPEQHKSKTSESYDVDDRVGLGALADSPDRDVMVDADVEAILQRQGEPQNG
jgi:transcriptional regulator with GAF, ATPase, and Fis domain